MTTSEKLSGMFRSLNDELQGFNDWWSDRVERCEAFELSMVGSDAVSATGRTSVEGGIDVQQLIGSRAVTATKKIIQRFEREDGQRPGSVIRLPSWAVIDGLNRGRIKRLNKKKDAFRESIASVVPAGIQRDRFCRRLFPGVAMLQVYRRFPLTERSFVPRRISFTWSPVTVSTKILSVQEALDLLDDREQITDETLSAPLLDSIAIARRLIATLPNNHLIARRKPVAPHPRVTLFGESTVQNEMLHANLPLLLSSRCTSVQVEPLKSFDPLVRRKARSDKKKIWPILESMNLYSLETGG